MSCSYVFSERTGESLLITDTVSSSMLFSVKLFKKKKKTTIVLYAWIKRIAFIQLKFNLKHLSVVMVAAELSLKLQNVFNVISFHC